MTQPSLNPSTDSNSTSPALQTNTHPSQAQALSTLHPLPDFSLPFPASVDAGSSDSPFEWSALDWFSSSKPPIGYSHYQPQPQPLAYPYATQQQPPRSIQPGGGKPQQQQQAMTNPPFVGIAQPFAGDGGAMGVGNAAGDFELFGPPPPMPADAGVGRGSNYGFPTTGFAFPVQQQQAHSPVPDLVSDRGSPASHRRSDSPPSPAFVPAVFPSRPSISSLSSDKSGGSYRSDRASSVPVLEAPKPVRRKTQESKDWPSFYSSGSSSSSSSGSAYLPTPQHNLNQKYLNQPFSNEPTSYTLQPTSTDGFDPSSLSLSPAQYPYVYQAPHTDHPLLPSEQSDLLDRVRRDLLDVDLASIKGPLRALALSGTNVASFDREKTPTPAFPTYAAHSLPPAANYNLRLSPAVATLAAAEADANSTVGTVSPQEAFLDYPAIDSRLHDPAESLARSEFGVGVGHSLFAPLPTVVPSSSPPPLPKSRARHSPPRATSRSPTPVAHGVATPVKARHPHPFSVPQNAVTWAERRSLSGRHLVGGIVDGDADDDDGDFGPSSAEGTEGEEEERRRLESVRKQAGLPDGFGRMNVVEANLKREHDGQGVGVGLSQEEMVRYGLDAMGVPLQWRQEVKLEEEKPAQASTFQAPPPRPPTTDLSFVLPMNPPAGPRAPTPSTSNAVVPPPPAQPSSIPASAVPPSLQFAAPRTSPSGTSTPRRTAAANALAGLHAHTSDLTDDDAASDELATGRPRRQRKRSRMAAEAYDSGEDAEGDEDDDEYLGDAAAGRRGAADESDESYHSSSNASYVAPTVHHRRTATSAPPTKRRRRAPAPSSTSTSSTAIICDHMDTSTGARCGVVFRRPYDLARHKETIHGESLTGEKLAPGKVKDWRCAECGGTFSRKDALLRHGRIRGHRTG
ncbi:hypothetical protein JCM21900_006934 [Sporobolomyces salmonicolor]